MKDFEKILDDIKEVAFTAGQAILGFYGQDCPVEYKATESPLTQADIASNKIILNHLGKYGYGILSEEGVDNEERLNEKRVWIVDPMDGTSDFINQTDEFAIMIGLAEAGRPIFGLVYAPVSDTYYYAGKGKSAYRQKGESEPEKIQVSSIKDSAKASMLTSRYHLSEDIKAIADTLGMKKFKPCGSSGLKIGLIAAGESDLNINTSRHTWEWDICAADIILSEAGGRLSDVKNREFTYNKKNPRNSSGYVASNGFIHNQIIGAIDEVLKYGKK